MVILFLLIDASSWRTASSKSENSEWGTSWASVSKNLKNQRDFSMHALIGHPGSSFLDVFFNFIAEITFFAACSVLRKKIGK